MTVGDLEVSNTRLKIEQCRSYYYVVVYSREKDEYGHEYWERVTSFKNCESREAAIITLLAQALLKLEGNPYGVKTP